MKLSTTWTEDVVNNISHSPLIEENNSFDLNIEDIVGLGLLQDDGNFSSRLNISSFGSFLVGKNYSALLLLFLCVVVVFGNVLVILSVAKVVSQENVVFHIDIKSDDNEQREDCDYDYDCLDGDDKVDAQERALQNVTNLFIVSLAIADLCVAGVVMPFYAYTVVGSL